MAVRSLLFRQWGDGNHLTGRSRIRIRKHYQERTPGIIAAGQYTLYRSVGKHGRDRSMYPQRFDEGSSHGSIL